MRLIYFLLCISSSILGISIPEKFSEFNLTKYGSIYLDKTNELTIEKLLKNPEAYPFEESKSESPSFGYLHYPVWFRVTISQRHKEKEKYVINIPSSLLDSIYIFEWNPKANSLKSFEMGDKFPFQERPIEHTSFAFYVELEKNIELTLFFRFQSDSSITFPILIYLEKDFHSITKKQKFIFGLYYGFLLGLIFYNLFLAFQILEASYFFYVGYMGVLFLLMSTGLGHSFEYLWPNAIDWNNRAFSFLNGALIFFSTLFVRYFLKINIQKNLIGFLLIFNAIIGFGFSLYSLFGNILISNKLVNAFSLIGLLIVSIAAIRSLKYEPRLAKFFLTAWGIFLIFSIFVILRLLGFLPRNFLTYYGTQIGSVFETLLLSFALADRIKQLETARKQAVEQKLKLQIQIQENLEKEIHKRSLELQKYNYSLQKDLNMARKIQSKIFPSGTYTFDNFLISIFYRPKDIVGGDFYSLHSFSENKLRIFLADATGHGVQAALITMTIKSEYDSLKEIISEPAEVLENLYQRFFETYEGLSLYFTSFLVDIDLTQKQIIYASVGHPNQYFIFEKKIFELTRTASLLDIVTSRKPIENKVVSISKPSKLVLFTDGIFEEFRNQHEQYGEPRLKEKLLALADLSPPEICEKVFEDVQIFIEPFSFLDDVTLIVVELK